MAPGTPCGPRIAPVFAQEVICSADRSHELLPLMIPGLPAPRRLPWPAAVPAGGRPSETRRPSRVTAARSASSFVGPVCSGSARATVRIPIESRAAAFIPATTTAWRWRGEAAHHIQTSPRALSVLLRLTLRMEHKERMRLSHQFTKPRRSLRSGRKRRCRHPVAKPPLQ